MKADPIRYCLLLPENPDQWFLFERVPRDELRNGGRAYTSKIVEAVVRNLGPFKYDDETSEKLLADLDQQVMARDEARVKDEEIMVKYFGQWSGSQRHGRGRQIWPDGTRYDGYWAIGEHNGYGRIVYPDGSYYIGFFKDNQRYGQGKLIRSDETSYDGVWSNDEQNGSGTEVWQDGRFEGQYQNGFRHGHGKFIMFDGSSYEGDFAQNMMEGQGKYLWPNGSNY